MAVTVGLARLWQPQEEGAREICTLLHEYQQPGVDQNRIFMQLTRCSTFPDFNNYLTFVFCRAEGQPIEVRQSAGLLLKNNLKTAWSGTAQQFQEYMKNELLPSIGVANRELRSTVGTVISVIVQQGGVKTWPELFPALAQCMDSNDYNHMDGAMDVLFKICEDMPEQLDVDVPGLPETPINAFLPRLLKFCTSQHANLRKLAVGTVNQFILHMPRALVVNMDKYLQSLFTLATDPSAEVRKLVCYGLVQLLEHHPEYLQPHMPNVIEYMLQANQDSNGEVALEACEFWSAFCEARLPPELLRDSLPRLVGVLLSNMVYADDDEALLSAEQDDNVPDREQDVKPFIPASKLSGGDGQDDEDDDEIINSWNLRKCSAAGLDTLSTVFHEEVLPILMPRVQQRLTNNTDAAWKDREAAVLALGAVAEGCIDGLRPHLNQIVNCLLPLLEDPRPLVRSITCWTLSRYSKYVVQSIDSAEGEAQMERVMMGLLRSILDGNKWVQEAACSAFATLEEDASDHLAPRLEQILRHLMFAFDKYQRKNLRILYDAIGTLADAVQGELNEPQYLEILMPPLIAKWQQLPDSDKDLFPLLECLTSIAQALGQGFAQYAEPVFQRCVNLIRVHLLAKTDEARAGIKYDKEFIVCSLDLLSGIAEGLGPGIESLVARSDLRDLLVQCCADDAPDVRQSSLAFLGDLAKSCVVHLQPRIPEFLQLAANQLQARDALAPENYSVANNACWAIGEVAVKVRAEAAPIVLPVVRCIVPILNSHSPEKLKQSLVENSAITLGRLAWVCPEQVAPHMEHFMQSWCRALKSIRDEVEKEHAFLGLCAMIRLNPAGAVSAFVPMCLAIGSWHEIRSEELRTELGQVLHGYKQMLGPTVWEQYMQALDQPLREKLARRYGI
ncbi:hypothetical protein CBR_g22065 [Chara braunii]|uniref:Transportin-1 n=1 Tax=Chara braunii TaxID=69332 RepID=A0A388L231_CHABU|nr:hypothetical protein CBR_g22065 [Chara braunii]|eukprot:GBG76318.1 hypothetical protein CBR_g22065 [Chara braunii]